MRKLRIKLKKRTDKTYGYRGSLLLTGDSVYYSEYTKSYSLFNVLSADKETVLLRGLFDDGKKMITSRKNEFFVRNVSVDVSKVEI